ncbi:hypothetical protein [Erythrobacter sp.]|uniref:hypothetical protein n=1 Tax=Erythrobacter sp. TaxID=1042 RepID=UPI00311F5721
MAAMHAPTTRTIPIDLLLRAYRAGVFPMADHRIDDDRLVDHIVELVEARAAEIEAEMKSQDAPDAASVA